MGCIERCRRCHGDYLATLRRPSITKTVAFPITPHSPPGGAEPDSNSKLQTERKKERKKEGKIKRKRNMKRTLHPISRIIVARWAAFPAPGASLPTSGESASDQTKDNRFRNGWKNTTTTAEKVVGVSFPSPPPPPPSSSSSSSQFPIHSHRAATLDGNPPDDDETIENQSGIEIHWCLSRPLLSSAFDRISL